MRYKKIPHDNDYRLSVPTLSGGVNVSTDATLIDDDQLAQVSNLRWHDGALKTRQSLRAVGYAPFTVLGRADRTTLPKVIETVWPHPFTVDGERCTAVIGMISYGDAAQRVLQIVSLRGTVMASYEFGASGTGSGIYALKPVCVVPCDRETYGYDFLVFHGPHVFYPDKEAGKLVHLDEDKLYAPLVMINGKSYVMSGTTEAINFSGGANGVMYEGFNHLTRRFRARYTGGGDGLTEFYVLPATITSAEEVIVEAITPGGGFTATLTKDDPSVTVQLRYDDTHRQNHAIALDIPNNRVTISPPLPESTVSDNVEIIATAADPTTDSARNSSLSTWFGGTNDRLGGTRLFLAGFTDRPAKVMWSDVNNPLYFPENNYMIVGDPSQAITALEKQGDMLLIFKERELYYTTYTQGSIDAESIVEGVNVDVTVMQAYFPLRQLSPYVGCDCPQTIATCRNRLVWMNADGRVYALASANMYSEANVREIGQSVHPLIRQAIASLDKEISVQQAASAMDHDGCYHLQIGRQAFVFDYSDSGFVNLGAYASGQRAVKHIAWHAYEYGDTLSEWNRVISDGDRQAILIDTRCLSPSKALVRVLYTFSDNAADAYMTLTNNDNTVITATVTDTPILSTLTTKTYRLGDAALYKRIKALWMIFCGAATLTTVADGTPSAAVSIRSTDRGIRRVFPGVSRCTRVAFRIDGVGALEVQGLRVQYSSYGAVV